MEGNFEEKLTHVFDICSKSQLQVKDDTCLKKLQSILEIQLQSLQAVEKCGALTFLDSVVLNHSQMDVATVDFSLHLAGILACQRAVYNVHGQNIMNFFKVLQDQSHQADLCVITSLYQVLTKLMLSNLEQQCLKTLLSNEFMNSTWKQLKEGRSLFLSNAVVHFLSIYLSKTFNESENKLSQSEYRSSQAESRSSQSENSSSQSENRSGQLDIRNELLDSIIQVLSTYRFAFQNKKKIEYSLHLIRSCFEIIMKEPFSFSGDDARASKLQEEIWRVLEHIDGEMLNMLVDCMVAICKCSSVDNKNSILAKVKTIIKELTAFDVMKAQKICLRLFTTKMLDPDVVEDTILYPLQLLCGVDTDNNCLTVDSIKKQMSSNASCSRIIQLSLDCLICVNQNKHKDLVVKILQLTLDVTNPKQLLQRHVSGNMKIQHKCLDYFIEGLRSEPDTQTISVICQLIQDKPQHMTFSKCLQCLQPTISWILQNKEDNQQICSAIESSTNCIQFQLCSTQWEFRDTTLEFLQNIINLNLGNKSLLDWLESSRLPVYVYQALSDGESYVRASALSCLQSLLMDTSLTVMLERIVSVSLDDIVTRVLEILSCDTEAFPRRAGVQLMTKCWLSKQHLLSETVQQQVFHCFSSTLPADFDWEVKLAVLGFWNLINTSQLDNNKSVTEIPLYARGLPENDLKVTSEGKSSKLKMFCAMLKNAIQIGLFDALFKLLDDYDQSVCQQACKELLTIKRSLQSKSSLCVPDQGSHTLSTTIPKQNKKTFLEKICEVCDSLNDKEREVLKQLDNLDLETKLLQYSDTCDEYDRNPESLLDDIISYSNTHSADEDNAIDCY